MASRATTPPITQFDGLDSNPRGPRDLRKRLRSRLLDSPWAAKAAGSMDEFFLARAFFLGI